jgi:hypothetical protein
MKEGDIKNVRISINLVAEEIFNGIVSKEATTSL